MEKKKKNEKNVHYIKCHIVEEIFRLSEIRLGDHTAGLNYGRVEWKKAG